MEHASSASSLTQAFQRMARPRSAIAAITFYFRNNEKEKKKEIPYAERWDSYMSGLSKQKPPPERSAPHFSSLAQRHRSSSESPCPYLLTPTPP